eukprot:TRINITY_DN56222_c0_g1_i1.p1 TRINITY_DN56222_c0_g1~~TRINITY_DN56222_c0_g1_i1.p1  ORF type:complete len:541 (+),score=143.36 TRINITY_DN56222_c0_g1_i1:94-1623(+)
MPHNVRSPGRRSHAGRSSVVSGSRCGSLHPEKGELDDDTPAHSIIGEYAAAPGGRPKALSRVGTWCLRALVMEFTGTLITNIIVLSIILTAAYVNIQAQMSTLLDTPAGTTGGMPPGVAQVPPYVPDADGTLSAWDLLPVDPVPIVEGMVVSFHTIDGWKTGTVTGADDSGMGSEFNITRSDAGQTVNFTNWRRHNVRVPQAWQPGTALPGIPSGGLARTHSHNYVVFPTDQLMVIIGLALGYAMGLLFSPGTQLNPTFTVAVCVFDLFAKPPTGKWKTAPAAVLGQMCGGTLAAAVVYGMGNLVLRTRTPGSDGYDLVDAPKLIQTAKIYGVMLPDDLMPTDLAFFNSTLWTVLFVLCIVPIFAQEAISGDRLHPIAKPFLVALVIVPLALAQTPFGVQNNAAIYISGLCFCSMAGWNTHDLWAAHNNYIWVVSVAPILGGVIGSVLLGVWLWLLYDPASPVVWRQEEPRSDDDDDDEDNDEEAGHHGASNGHTKPTQERQRLVQSKH